MQNSVPASWFQTLTAHQYAGPCFSPKEPVFEHPLRTVRPLQWRHLGSNPPPPAHLRFVQLWLPASALAFPPIRLAFRPSLSASVSLAFGRFWPSFWFLQSRPPMQSALRIAFWLPFLLYAPSSALFCPLHVFPPTRLAFRPSLSASGSLAF